jgi:DNA-binding XRE family transcriptional regulator
MSSGGFIRWGLVAKDKFLMGSVSETNLVRPVWAGSLMLWFESCAILPVISVRCWRLHYGTSAVSVKDVFAENIWVSKRKSSAWLKQLGDNIRRERNVKGMSQQRLAEGAELDIRSVQRIEAGEINVLLITARRIGKALGCPLERLVPAI